MSADSANLSPLAADLATSLHLSHLQHHAVTNHTHATAAAAVNNNHNTTTTTAPRIMMKIGGGKDEKRKSEASLDSESDAESLSSGAPATASSTTAAAAAAAAGEAPLPPQKRVRCSTATPLPVPLLVDEPDHDADARRLLPADVAAASSPALLQTPCVARPLPINAFFRCFFLTHFFRFSFFLFLFSVAGRSSSPNTATRRAVWRLAPARPRSTVCSGATVWVSLAHRCGAGAPELQGYLFARKRSGDGTFKRWKPRWCVLLLPFLFFFFFFFFARLFLLTAARQVHCGQGVRRPRARPAHTHDRVL